MSKIAVVYWSGTGNTQEMADYVAAGARDAGAEVTQFTATDFSADKLKEFSAIAFGCPAMGSEELEDTEFKPMFDDITGSLGNSKIALFGSYGWGDGEWMRTWEDDCRNAKATLVCESVIANDAPDDDAAASCKALGASLAKA